MNLVQRKRILSCPITSKFQFILVSIILFILDQSKLKLDTNKFEML